MHAAADGIREEFVPYLADRWAQENAVLTLRVTTLRVSGNWNWSWLQQVVWRWR
jgi:hypothetical protein